MIKVQHSPAPEVPNADQAHADHYFFRFGEDNNVYLQNYGLIDSLNAAKGIVHLEAEQRRNPFYLAVYYTEFSARNYTPGDVAYFEALKLKKGEKLQDGDIRFDPRAVEQVRLFFEAKPGAVFWVFLDEYLVAFEMLHGAVEDSTSPSFRDKNGTLPKARPVRPLGAFFRSEVPELFGTTDSSGFRGTVMRLKGPRNKKENYQIGLALLGGVERRILLQSAADALKYLSPIQLETVFFKLFNDNGCFVTSHRGGSRKRVDICVLDTAATWPIPHFAHAGSSLLIQVKRSLDKVTVEDLRRDYFQKGLYLATLDDRFHAHPALKNETHFIGTEKLRDILQSPAASTTAEWLKKVLGEKCFRFEF